MYFVYVTTLYHNSWAWFTREEVEMEAETEESLRSSVNHENRDGMNPYVLEWTMKTETEESRYVLVWTVKTAGTEECLRSN